MADAGHRLKEESMHEKRTNSPRYGACCLAFAMLVVGAAAPASALPAGVRLKKNPPLTFARNKTAPSGPGQWVSIGPSRILEDFPSGQFNAVGRLTTMAVHPTNPQIIYVGSPGASGHEGCGVWKTANGGASWTPVADSLPSLAVDAIAIDPSNPDRVYVVLFRHGLYRSDDAGMSWTHLYGDLHVRTNIGAAGDRTALLIHPIDPRVLYVTTDLGVQRSTDGGQSWHVSLGAGMAMSLVMDPREPNTLYAGLAATPPPPEEDATYRTMGVYKTTDGGASGEASWTPQTQLPFGTLPGRNILLAISHPVSAAQATVYALFPRGPVYAKGLFGGIGYDLFRTTDGTTWSMPFSCSPDLVNPFPTSYANCNFAVMNANPFEADTLYLGGVAFFTSADGGANFERVPFDDFFDVQPKTPHVDYWELVTDPVSPATLYAASDGGLYESSDHGKNGTWIFIGKGITNVEMFDLAIAKTVSNGGIRAISGTQDNGSASYDGSLEWRRFAGGDGGAVAIDPLDSDRFYFSGNEGDVSQSSDAGVTFQPFLSGIPSDVSTKCHAYDSTFQLLTHPATSEPVLDACGLLWRTTRIAPPDPAPPDIWSEIFGPPTGDRVVRAAIDSSIDLYYAGTMAGRLFAGPGGAGWQPVFTHPNLLKVSDIDVDAAHPDKIYASFAPPEILERNCDAQYAPSRIYQLRRSSPTPSTATTIPTDITNNLPAGLCVNALAIDPKIPRTLYAGTDKGVYRGRSNSTGGPWVWELYDNGMPPAGVRDLEVDAAAGEIYAATFGRGALKVTLETTLPVSIDIKPGGFPNSINAGSHGNTPVAILSTVTFDAPSEVDEESLTFGRTGGETSLVSCNDGGDDVNDDGLLDLVCRFATALTEFQAGDNEGILKGKTVEGTPIIGRDSVNIVP
jgi:hypothetical protein